VHIVNHHSVLELVSEVRDAFNTGITRPLQWRREQLLAMLRLLTENDSEFVEAVCADVHKSRAEANLTELFLVRNEIADAVSHLERWCKTQKPSVALVNKFDGIDIVWF